LRRLPQHLPGKIGPYDIVAERLAQPVNVRVWDLPTRLFHWTFVTLILCAWVSSEFASKINDPTLKWHRWNGYAILVLVVFRLIWGFAGSSTSRFSSFMRWPRVALSYGLDVLRGRERPFLGHNPLGSWMVLMLLGAVAAQSVLGLYTLEHNDITAGPLNRTISEETSKVVGWLHVRGFNVILALAALHVLANSLYQIVKKDPLITAMVTGVKPARHYEDGPEAAIARNSGLRALACLVAAVTLVFGGILLLGGRII
jgi:cytochrome b